MRRGLIGLLMLSWITAGCGASQTAEGPPPPPPPSPPAPVEPAPPPTPPEPPPAPKLSMLEMQKKHMDASNAAWAAHDAKALAALYAPTVVFGYPSMDGWRDTPGRAGLEKNMGDFFVAFPDAKVTHVRGHHVGDVLVLEWLLSGTHQGEFMGIAPTNRKLGYHGASILWFGDDGQVVREHMYFDHGTFMMQLGAAPKGMQGRPVAELPADAKAEWTVAQGSDAEKKNTELLTAFLVTYEKKDVKAFGEALSEDAARDNYARPADPPRGKLSGREFAKKAMAQAFKSMPDMKWTTSNMWAAGDYVIVEGSMTGTFKGAMGPIKPTNKTGTVHALDVVHVKDGKLDHMWSYGSSVEFAGAFGLMPKPKAPPAAKATPATAKPAPPAKPATAAPPAKPATPTKPAAPGATQP